MVKKQVLDTIRKQNLMQKGQHIVIGLSGGPDSVCLFHVLCSMAEEWKLTIHPVHINHQFRPGAAEEDQRFVEMLCERTGWPCQTFEVDCNRIVKEEKITSEEAGRKVRYEAFAKVAQEIRDGGIPSENVVIVVAQNADDQAETILFRILRGAGTDGLAGINYSRRDEAGTLIVRPLLDCYKKDILAYCKEHQLNPCIDQTNMEPIYTRNKIRLKLIPQLEQEYNHNFKDTMIRMGKACAQDSDCLWQMAKDVYGSLVKAREPDFVLLDGPGLHKLHRAIRQRVISMAFNQIGLSEDVTFVHFERCEDIVFHQSPSARLDLPKGYYLTKYYEDIKAARRAESKESKFLRVQMLSLEEYQELNLSKDSHAAFDAEQMEEAYGETFAERIVLGKREAGDTIAIGECRTKKIQDYFVDRKIPRDQRDKIDLVKIGHDTLWVRPYEGKGRFSSKFKLCQNTKKVICIEIICDLC